MRGTAGGVGSLAGGGVVRRGAELARGAGGRVIGVGAAATGTDEVDSCLAVESRGCVRVAGDLWVGRCISLYTPYPARRGLNAIIIGIAMIVIAAAKRQKPMT
jgi:hypothetical protein